MLRLFKCQSVQSVWYLVADYRIQCFDAQWYFHAVFAGIAISVFIIGIPLVIYIVLWRNRSYLYEQSCPAHKMHRHVKIARRLGAVYSETEPNYYFDLLAGSCTHGRLVLVGSRAIRRFSLEHCCAWAG